MALRQMPQVITVHLSGVNHILRNMTVGVTHATRTHVADHDGERWVYRAQEQEAWNEGSLEPIYEHFEVLCYYESVLEERLLFDVTR